MVNKSLETAPSHGPYPSTTSLSYHPPTCLEFYRYVYKTILYSHVSLPPMARSHATALPTEVLPNHMAQQHHLSPIFSCKSNNTFFDIGCGKEREPLRFGNLFNVYKRLTHVFCNVSKRLLFGLTKTRKKSLEQFS